MKKNIFCKIFRRKKDKSKKEMVENEPILQSQSSQSIAPSLINPGEITDENRSLKITTEPSEIHHLTINEPDGSIDDKEEEKKALDLRRVSLNLPRINRRSTRLFDLVNSVMNTKPTLLEGIPDQLIEPTVVSLTPELSKEEEEIKEEIREDEVKKIHPREIAQTLQQGFRNDFMSLSEDRCFLTKKRFDKKNDMITDFMRDTPLQFMIRIGFSVEEAVTRARNINFSSALRAAIIEASIWTHSLTTEQTNLIILLAYKARPNMMRYYLQLVEAIVNMRIKDVVRLNGFIFLLEATEIENLNLSDYFEEQVDEKDIEKEMLRQKRGKLYAFLLKKVNSEAKKTPNPPGPKRIENLLKYLTAEYVYKPAVYRHAKLFAHYIGHNRITTTAQIEAAIIYLEDVEKHKVNRHEFEEFCGIRVAFVPPRCWPWPPLDFRTEEIEDEEKTDEEEDILL